MDLIVETDIGHDPDDFFAITWLISQGVNIRTILISPGDPDQVAIAKLICKECGLDIPIGTSKENRTKMSSGSIHYELLERYKLPKQGKADGLGIDIIPEVLRNYPDCELFICGPVSSIGKYLNLNSAARFKRATMQGGFLPYSRYEPKVTHSPFLFEATMQTFNLNGDIPGAKAFLRAAIDDRRMVGKNVCHTVKFTQEKIQHLINCKDYYGKNTAQRLFNQASLMYFQKHSEKKFHDPVAAVCHLYPEIGTWYRGNTMRVSDSLTHKPGWTTMCDPDGDHILADIDRDKFWKLLLG